MTDDNYDQLAQAAATLKTQLVRKSPWGDVPVQGTYATQDATQVLQSLATQNLSLPTPVALLVQALPSTAAVLGGSISCSLVNAPYRDIDIWCLKGAGSPYDDAVDATAETLNQPTFAPGQYTKTTSKGGTAVFSSQSMPAITIHKFVFDDVNHLLDCMDFTILQIVPIGLEAFVCGPSTVSDLNSKTLRYAQMPSPPSPLWKEQGDLRLRKYMNRGFKPDTSIAAAIRAHSPLLANQLEAQRARQSASSQQAATPSILPPVKPPPVPLTQEILEPDTQPAQVPVGDPLPNVESRVTDNPFMKLLLSK